MESTFTFLLELDGRPDLSLGQIFLIRKYQDEAEAVPGLDGLQTEGEVEIEVPIEFEAYPGRPAPVCHDPSSPDFADPGDDPEVTIDEESIEPELRRILDVYCPDWLELHENDMLQLAAASKDEAAANAAQSRYEARMEARDAGY